MHVGVGILDVLQVVIMSRQVQLDTVSFKQRFDPSFNKCITQLHKYSTLLIIISFCPLLILLVLIDVLQVVIISCQV